MLALMSGFIKLRVTATKEKKQHEAEAGIPISEIKGGGGGGGYITQWIVLHRGLQLKPI